MEERWLSPCVREKIYSQGLATQSQVLGHNPVTQFQTLLLVPERQPGGRAGQGVLDVERERPGTPLNTQEKSIVFLRNCSAQWEMEKKKVSFVIAAKNYKKC